MGGRGGRGQEKGVRAVGVGGGGWEGGDGGDGGGRRSTHLHDPLTHHVICWVLVEGGDGHVSVM